MRPLYCATIQMTSTTRIPRNIRGTMIPPLDAKQSALWFAKLRTPAHAFDNHSRFTAQRVSAKVLDWAGVPLQAQAEMRPLWMRCCDLLKNDAMLRIDQLTAFPRDRYGRQPLSAARQSSDAVEGCCFQPHLGALLFRAKRLLQRRQIAQRQCTPGCPRIEVARRPIVGDERIVVNDRTRLPLTTHLESDLQGRLRLDTRVRDYVERKIEYRDRAHPKCDDPHFAERNSSTMRSDQDAHEQNQSG